MISNFSIFCKFVFVTFTIFRFLGPFGLQFVALLGSHLVPLAPICGSSGLPFDAFWFPPGSLLASVGSIGSSWFPFGSLWQSFGSLWVSFAGLLPFSFFLAPLGFHLASFDALLAPFGFPLALFWLPKAPFWPLWLPWPRSGSFLAMQWLCNEGTIGYIYSTRNKARIHVCT